MKITAIEDITPEKWVNLEATVLQIWMNDHPAIRQVGVLQDDTGIVKFVSWNVSNLPLLELGMVYQFKAMPVTEYEGRYSVAMVSTTEIERLTMKPEPEPEIPTV